MAQHFPKPGSDSLLRLFLGLIAAGVPSLACAGDAATTVVEADVTEETEWVRLLRTEGGKAKALETSIVRFTKGDTVVDLIGAIHVGDKAYYEALNDRFEDYEAVLYELVAEKDAIKKGTRAAKNDRGASMSLIGSMQTGMKDLLELEHQLSLIDYRADNMVHADMSPKQFAEKMQERGESWFTMFMNIMTKSMAAQSKSGRPPSDFEIIAMLFDKDRATKLKGLMAEQFTQMDVLTDTFSGPDGSTIITERNAVALDELKKQLAAGQTEIGIFYGAGHMPDMEERLIEDFGFERGETTWLTAWNIAGDDSN
ncbi:hypothetical protein [Stratiformator vulcanicus]|uniref:TraB family protein n=1 Tax=Stratiformator vulcanicus TaxID=2527980 RepID=A0A517QZV0_9PLAN|nr:hypothetical protein [Stratiformator vulcanicus]QDT37161.1 TraB family protein [Stratiformator vulcanicus]